MLKVFKKIELPQRLSQTLFILCLGTIVIYNSIKFNEERKHIQLLKKLIPHQIIGHKLTGLENYTRGIEIMGYFTDASAEDEEQSKLFSYAQYILAPTILDYNNLDHEYTLLVCRSQQAALAVMNQIHAEAYKQNKYGMILARRRP
jgi:hypothetical protein